MGAWGVKIFQDDVAEDVKDEYVLKLRVGIDNETITNEMIDIYTDDYELDEDTIVFYLALADIQWQYGNLLSLVKEKAIWYIDSGADLERWKENIKLYSKRKKVLEELKNKLESINPKPKKPSRLRPYLAPWKVGDLLLYKIQCDENKKSKWYGKYVLMRVIGFSKSYINYIPKDLLYYERSIISLYNWIGNEYVEGIEKKLSFIKTKNTYDCMDERFKSLPKEFSKFDIKVLSNDSSFCNKKIINKDVIPDLPRIMTKEMEEEYNGKGFTWPLSMLVLEYEILEALNSADIEKNLIVEM